jgi:endoglucanase
MKILAVLLLLLLSSVLPAEDRLIQRFNTDPAYGIGTWEKAFDADKEGLLIKATSAKGGVGYPRRLDLSADVGRVPRLSFTLLQPGQSRHINLRLIDADQTRATFTFRFHPATAGKTYTLSETTGIRWTDPAAITEPGGNGVLDLDGIVNLQILGDWRNAAIEVRLHDLSSIEDGPETQAAREKARIAAERETARLAALEQARRDRIASVLERGAEHPADGPRVLRASLAAPNLIALDIQELEFVVPGQIDFVPGPEHELRPSDKQVLAWREGRAEMTPKSVEVFVGEGKAKTSLGFYLPHAGKLWRREQLTGAAIDLDLIDTPQAYRVYIGDSTTAISPVSVARKSKPNDGPMYGNEKAILHRVYLRLPAPVPEGQALRVVFHGLNTRENDTAFTPDPARDFNEALQVSQVGFRADDPWKQASLSLWLGSGDGQSFDAWIGKDFFLVDEKDGSRHPAGVVRKRMDKDEVQSSFRTKRNHADAAIYELDFSSFDRPGRYRIAIDGLGVSLPFPIGDNAWEHAFQVSMKGFLHHRSGIALAPPFTSYKRPLNFHPDAGTRALQSDVTRLDGESAAIFDSLSRIHSSAEVLPNAWGGYMDAGDWDRRAQHLESTFLHLELLELFPERLGRVKLALPPAEAENNIPDLLDEALWNIDFYARLQTAEGGIRGGVESTEHPREGEASWQESLLVGIFTPDAASSHLFAATAIKASALLKPFDAPRAAALEAAALRAWDWAEANPVPDSIPAKYKQQDALSRNLAAAQLFALTGKEDYLAVFKAGSSLVDGESKRWGDEADAIFVIATLPDARGQNELRQQARDVLRTLADAAVKFQEGNAFHLAAISPLPLMGYVGYFSVPEMVSQMLPRAHFLTGDERYLAAAVAASNFSNGANPNNLVYTTGLGERFPRNPLHIDSRVTAQPAPAGITVYGQSDPQEGYGFNEWVHTYHLQGAFPPSREWPTAEAYFDIFLWPAQSEYTVHQTLGPASYYRGYLTGR